MKSHIGLFLIVLQVFAGPLRAVQGEDWKEYTDQRFGFRIEYPGSLRPGRPPDNGAGQKFRSVDGRVSLVAQGHFLQEPFDTLEKRWREDLRSYGSHISYARKGTNWYVVSGVLENGFEFYLKVAAKGDNWASFEITYPHTEHAKYDRWVERILKSFIPFLPGQWYDRSD